jgi:hypothetical protein
MDPAAPATKPLLSQLSELISACADLLWPLLVVAALILFRHRLAEIIGVAVRKLESSSELKIGGIELKGVVITPQGEVIVGRDTDFEILEADKADVDHRHAAYKKTRNLMLVHTIRPKKPEEFIDGFRVFDVSIFLHPHRNFGRLNDVASVTYFLGDKWGDSPYGEKYVVSSANEQFALTVGMYGSFLCVADIAFHDGRAVRMQRYIDVEMAPVYNVSLTEARGR